jgi:predicted MFS family arabinose efflux permease
MTTKPARRSVGVVLVTLCGAAIGYSFADYAPLIPLLGPDLGIDEVRAGLLTTALFVIFLAGTLVTTGLAERFGPKLVVGAGLACTLIGTVALAVAPAYTVALLGKTIQGLGATLTFIAGTRYIAGLYGAGRSHFALGVYGGGYPLGSALALVAMPLFADSFGGWRPAFWIEAALVAACLAAWWLGPAVPRVMRPGSMREALRCGNCWWTSLQHAGFGLAVASGTWITVFLLRELRISLTEAGALGSVLLVITTVARPFGGLVVARGWLRTRQAMALSNVLIIAGVAMVVVPERPLAIALVGTVLLGIGGGLPYAAIFNTLAASLPQAPAASQGLAVIVGALVILAVAPAMGYGVQLLGFWAAWSLIGAVAAFALAATVFTRGEEELA